MQHRWYDIDATVSLAVSLMKNAKMETQLKCADYIITKVKNYGIANKENLLTDAFTYLLRRWYDNDKKISEAFEYLKSAPTDVQKEIALDLINVLQLP